MRALPRGKRKPEQQDAQQAQQRRRRAQPKRSTSEEEIKSISESLSERLIQALGLDLIGLKAVDIKDIVYSIVGSLAESRSSKLTEEAAMKRIVAMKDNLFKAIAASLLSSGRPLTREQLEFIVAYAPEIAGRAAPYLYREAVRLRADDIIGSLRALWSQYGRPTPVECPRCGFRAVTPDLTCIVCGAQLSEGELKRHLNFASLLQGLASRLHPRLVEEIISAGYVVLDDDVRPPSMAPRQGFAIVIHLSRAEKEALSGLLFAQQSQTKGGEPGAPQAS
jgi:hypothetical protein